MYLCGMFGKSNKDTFLDQVRYFKEESLPRLRRLEKLIKDDIMKNYIKIDGKKIKISDETAAEFRDQFSGVDLTDMSIYDFVTIRRGGKYKNFSFGALWMKGEMIQELHNEWVKGFESAKAIFDKVLDDNRT